MIAESVLVDGDTLAEQPPTTAELHEINAQRLTFALSCIVGRTVKVQMSDGTWIEGVFHSCSSPTIEGPSQEKRGTEIILKGARQPATADRKSSEIWSSLVVNTDLIYSLSASDCSLDFNDVEEPSVIKRGFKTDAEIAGGSGGDERELQRWRGPMDAESNVELKCLEGNTGEWDQFEVNRRKFNVGTTYAEDLYTTHLDMEMIPADVRMKAERLANEIENQPTRGPKDPEKDEKGDASSEEVDEEALFGAVRGTGAYANENMNRGRGGRPPSGLRGLKPPKGHSIAGELISPCHPGGMSLGEIGNRGAVHIKMVPDSTPPRRTPHDITISGPYPRATSGVRMASHSGAMHQWQGSGKAGGPVRAPASASGTRLPSRTPSAAGHLWSPTASTANQNRYLADRIVAHGPVTKLHVVNERGGLNALNLEPAVPKVMEITRQTLHDLKSSLKPRNKSGKDGRETQIKELAAWSSQLHDRMRNKGIEPVAVGVAPVDSSESKQLKRSHTDELLERGITGYPSCEMAKGGLDAAPILSSSSGSLKGFQFNPNANAFTPSTPTSSKTSAAPGIGGTTPIAALTAPPHGQRPLQSQNFRTGSTVGKGLGIHAHGGPQDPSAISQPARVPIPTRSPPLPYPTAADPGEGGEPREVETEVSDCAARPLLLDGRVFTTLADSGGRLSTVRPDGLVSQEPMVGQTAQGPLFPLGPAGGVIPVIASPVGASSDSLISYPQVIITARQPQRLTTTAEEEDTSYSSGNFTDCTSGNAATSDTFGSLVPRGAVWAHSRPLASLMAENLKDEDVMDVPVEWPYTTKRSYREAIGVIPPSIHPGGYIGEDGFHQVIHPALGVGIGGYTIPPPSTAAGTPYSALPISTTSIGPGGQHLLLTQQPLLVPTTAAAAGQCFNPSAMPFHQQNVRGVPPRPGVMPHPSGSPGGVATYPQICSEMSGQVLTYSSVLPNGGVIGPQEYYTMLPTVPGNTAVHDGLHMVQPPSHLQQHASAGSANGGRCLTHGPFGSSPHVGPAGRGSGPGTMGGFGGKSSVATNTSQAYSGIGPQERTSLHTDSAGGSDHQTSVLELERAGGLSASGSGGVMVVQSTGVTAPQHFSKYQTNATDIPCQIAGGQMEEHHPPQHGYVFGPHPMQSNVSAVPQPSFSNGFRAASPPYHASVAAQVVGGLDGTHQQHQLPYSASPGMAMTIAAAPTHHQQGFSASAGPGTHPQQYAAAPAAQQGQLRGGPGSTDSPLDTPLQVPAPHQRQQLMPRPQFTFVPHFMPQSQPTTVALGAASKAVTGNNPTTHQQQPGPHGLVMSGSGSPTFTARGPGQQMSRPAHIGVVARAVGSAAPQHNSPPSVSGQMKPPMGPVGGSMKGPAATGMAPQQKQQQQHGSSPYPVPTLSEGYTESRLQYDSSSMTSAAAIGAPAIIVPVQFAGQPNNAPEFLPRGRGHSASGSRMPDSVRAIHPQQGTSAGGRSGNGLGSETRQPFYRGASTGRHR